MYVKPALVIALVLSSAVIVAAQQTPTTSAKEFKTGQLIPIEGDLRLRVSIARTSAFASIAIDGTPLVVTLEFSDPVQKHSDAHYLIMSFNRDKPDASKIAVAAGAQRFIPVAYLDGFPDPTGQMPEIKDRTASAKVRASVIMKTIIDSTPEKPFLSFLFDLPADASKLEKRLFLTLDKQQIVVLLDK